MQYRDREKHRQIQLKPRLFGIAAEDKGPYKENDSIHLHEFCLPAGRSQENLFPGLRKDAIRYFAARGIGWHDGYTAGVPSTHLCCSQSACVNTFFAYRNQPEKLRTILTYLGYDVDEVLPITLDACADDAAPGYVAFEWIGEKNYLRELSAGVVAPDAPRTRGASFTSADFAFRFKKNDGAIQIVLGEWKYTEHYPYKSKQISGAGTDRLEQVYRPFLEKPGCTIQLQGKAELTDLFFDPFDQLMRLQLLAREMEAAGEMGATEVTVLHVSPEANGEFQNRVTSKKLECFGGTVYDIWSAIVQAPKFKHLFTSGLIGGMQVPENRISDVWANYITARYY